MSVDESELVIFETTPTAAALVAAVSDHNPHDVERILTGLDTRQLYAVAVVLASNVEPQSPLGRRAGLPLAPEETCEFAVTRVAGLFNTTPEDVLGPSRYRNVLDARACAMAACRLVGLSSTFIGQFFDRDHTTVLHAAARVGENARLRRVANSIADQIGERHLFGEAGVA